MNSDEYFSTRKSFEDLTRPTDSELREQLQITQERIDFASSQDGIDPVEKVLLRQDACALRTEIERRQSPRQRAQRSLSVSMNAAEHLTEMGNAVRFARIHGGKVKYCKQMGWLIWDGKRYRRDDTGEVFRLAREVVKSIYAEASHCNDKDRREKIAAWAHKSETDSRIGAMVHLAESELEIATTADVFDRDPFLLNVANGTINLKTGVLQSHRQEDLITKITPIPYGDSAPCSRWYKIIETVTGDDPALATYLQKTAGYYLTGDTSEQEFHLWHGPTAAGKTTLARTFSKALGDYAVQSPAETFLIKKNGAGIPNDIARLAGARLVVAMETEANQRLAESLVKALTGGDRIAARFLHREFFEFEPSFKLLLSTNHKPRIVGSDDSIWRRVRLIPFSVTIPKKDQDKHLAEKLEAELPGILRWMVEGCLLWQREGLEPPAAVTGASTAYRQDMDNLGEFLTARCEVGTDATVTAKDLYTAYVEWADSQKERERDRLSRIAFGHALSERGFEAGRNKAERYWKRLKLRGELW